MMPWSLHLRRKGRVHSSFNINNPVTYMALRVSALRIIFGDSTISGTCFKITRNLLNILYPGRCIGRGRLRTRPARSPDLTILDFFVSRSEGH
jgi:hypothetical protein